MIKELLEKGEEKAKTGKELCYYLGITARELTQYIEKERRAGAPICANTGRNPGYYLAANKEEMQKYCRSLYHRAGEIHKTRKSCLETLVNLP